MGSRAGCWAGCLAHWRSHCGEGGKEEVVVVESSSDMMLTYSLVYHTIPSFFLGGIINILAVCVISKPDTIVSSLLDGINGA